jgi:hypothetical protein
MRQWCRRGSAYTAIKKLSVFPQQSQRYVINSNFSLRGSESINRILLPHVVHGNSATRKYAQVGVGGGAGSIVASRIGDTQRHEHAGSMRFTSELNHYS